jgi:phosphoribosyl-AMP cyclohydrolase
MSAAAHTGGEAVAADRAPADWLDAVRWDPAGLVAAIAQDAASGRILMVAWMNREALAETARTGRAVYYSRSRARLWRKGEESGHAQAVREIRLDCDGDAIVLQVQQAGGIACHTGRTACFFSRLVDGRWVVVDPVLRDPSDIYRSTGEPQ